MRGCRGQVRSLKVSGPSNHLSAGVMQSVMPDAIVFVRDGIRAANSRACCAPICALCVCVRVLCVYECVSVSDQHPRALGYDPLHYL